jgi:hypothetical protein
MDRKKFEEKVEEYMFFDKKSLAELLAMRDLKEENNVVRPIKYVVKKTCSAVPGYCYQDCRECLFSQANPDVKVVDENCPTVSDTDTNKMFLVDPSTLPTYTTTTGTAPTFTTTTTAGDVRIQ